MKSYDNDIKKCMEKAYNELLTADRLGLYKYTVTENNATITQQKNYKRKLKQLEEKFDELKPILPIGTTLINIPREPKIIMQELENDLTLLFYKQEYLVLDGKDLSHEEKLKSIKQDKKNTADIDIDSKVIMLIKSLFGVDRMPKRKKFIDKIESQETNEFDKTSLKIKKMLFQFIKPSI